MMRTPDNIFTGAYYYLLDNVYRSPLYLLLIICCPALYVLWVIARHRSGFCSFPPSLIFCLTCSASLFWTGEWRERHRYCLFTRSIGSACYVYMMNRFEILRTTPAERKFDSALARTLMYIGVPMGLQFSITAIGSIMLQSANNALGTACVAAFTAAMRIKMFFMCPFESLGMAMATYSGQNYGAGKPERIWQGVKASALMMIVYWAFTFAVLMVGPKRLLYCFVEASEVEILKDAELFSLLSSFFFFFFIIVFFCDCFFWVLFFLGPPFLFFPFSLFSALTANEQKVVYLCIGSWQGNDRT